jgi:hypothetical protein
MNAFSEKLFPEMLFQAFPTAQSLMAISQNMQTGVSIGNATCGQFIVSSLANSFLHLNTLFDIGAMKYGSDLKKVQEKRRI